jgi:hypothetical protein
VLAGDSRTREQRLRVVPLPRHYGGVISYLECPNRACRKLVKTLYLDELEFRCRICARLVYPSQKQSGLARRSARVVEIKGLLEDAARPGRLRRPSGMRQKRYDLLRAELSELEARVRAEAVERYEDQYAKIERQLAALERGETRLRDPGVSPLVIDEDSDVSLEEEFYWALQDLRDAR